MFAVAALLVIFFFAFTWLLFYSPLFKSYLTLSVLLSFKRTFPRVVRKEGRKKERLADETATCRVTSVRQPFFFIHQFVQLSITQCDRQCTTQKNQWYKGKKTMAKMHLGEGGKALLCLLSLEKRQDSQNKKREEKKPNYQPITLPKPKRP
jgi:hypothetical protein